MVKKITVVLLCTALGNTLYARDDISTSNLFLGIEVESTKVDSFTEATITDAMYNVLDFAKFSETGSSVVEYGARLGAEKEDWRTTLLYTYYNNEDLGIEETMHKGSLLLDYYVWSSSFQTAKIKPYIGAHIGYMSYEVSGNIDGYGGLSQNYADDNGMFYGGQAGIALTVAEKIQFDLSYKYSFTSVDNIINDENLGNGRWLDTVTSIDNMGTIAFSINYFYN